LLVPLGLTRKSPRLSIAVLERSRSCESEGFSQTLHGKQREEPATAKILSGDQEAKLIAMRLGSPPKGYANWTLRLLASKLVELEVVEAISHETVRSTLKKTA
jgi:hypothetical protein